MRALTEYNNRDQVGRINMFLIFNIVNSLLSPTGLFISPENMHNKVCKMALGVHSKASKHAVKGELGRFPLHLIIYTRIFKYFLRLLTLQNNQILNSALEINIHLNNVSKHSWFTTYCKTPITLYQI